MERRTARTVYVDETSLRIRSRWSYYYVILNGKPKLMMLMAILPSRSQ
ncbi:MAG: hypothetical protein ACRERE_00695 [Candidatus Entotheonellia bacterium]